MARWKKQSRIFVEPPKRTGIKRWFVRGIADGTERTVYAKVEKVKRRRRGRIAKLSRRRNRG